jgi:hypothetical protein
MTTLYVDVERPFRQASAIVYGAFANLTESERAKLGHQLRQAFPLPDPGQRDPYAPHPNMFLNKLGRSLSRSALFVSDMCTKTIADAVYFGHADELIRALGDRKPFSTIGAALQMAQGHHTDAGIFRRDPRLSCDNCFAHAAAEPCPRNT